MLELCLTLVLAGLAVSLPATHAARALGRRLNALDSPGVPGQVKAPLRKVPNTGGIGIVAGIVVPIGAALAIPNTDLAAAVTARVPELNRHLPGIADQTPAALWLLGAALVLHITGLIDDRRALGALPKLAVMLAVITAVVVATDTRLLELLDASVGGPWLSVAVTVLWIGLITNAFNFLDNMDGLSAGVAAIAGAFFLVAALVAQPPQWFVAATLAVLVGSLLGFLAFNFPWRLQRETPDGRRVGGASVFMGDSGSLVIGFLLGFLTVRITYLAPASGAGDAPARHALFMPLVILAVPLYDFVSVSAIRISQGKSPFVGDLQHFSHRLVRHGLSKRAAVLVIYGCTAVTSIGAVSLPSLQPWQAALVGVQTLLVLGVLGLYEWSRGQS